MKRRMFLTGAALAVAAGLAATSAAAEQSAFGPFNMQSGKVYKPFGSLGKTAHREQWFRAPAGHYFVEESIKVQMISAHGKNAGVRIAKVEKAPFSVTLANGDTVTMQLPVAFLAVAHAETGSDRSKAVTAWAEAKVGATLQDTD